MTGTNTLLDTGTVPIPVPDGGTGNSTATAYAVQCGGSTSTGAFQSIASVGTSGQVLTSNGAGALPTFQAAGSVGAFWVAASGTTQAAAVNTGYICTNGSACAVTLPATAAVGSVVGLIAAGASGSSLVANTGQTIKYISQTTSTAGSLTTAHQYETMQVVCVVANTTWASLPANTSGLTYA